MDERRVWAGLARAPGLTARSVRAAAACADGLAQLAARHAAAAPRALIDADLRWLEASGACLVPCTSPLYPPLLTRVAGAPPVLYALGRPEALAARQIAMVGARAATATGRALARELAAAFARAGIAVASGLAVGIDAASHQGALDAEGVTVAVCAHGLDALYPREHHALAGRIRERGALISRFPPGAPPRRAHFPQRNRMLSGLAFATVVVEASRHSGSLITARAAMQNGRPVFAVPGSVRSPLSAGCHELIRQGARLAAGPSEVLQDLGISISDQILVSTPSEGPAPPGRSRPLDKDGEILLDALGFEPVSISTLAERTGLASGCIASMLLILELRGRVALHPGGRYCRLT